MSWFVQRLWAPWDVSAAGVVPRANPGGAPNPAQVLLAQCVAYLARAPKLRSRCTAPTTTSCLPARPPGPLPPVPLHLRNAPTRLMKDLATARATSTTPATASRVGGAGVPAAGAAGRDFFKQRAVLDEAADRRGLAEAVPPACASGGAVSAVWGGAATAAACVTWRCVCLHPVRRDAHETFWQLRAMDSRYKEVSILVIVFKS